MIQKLREVQLLQYDLAKLYCISLHPPGNNTEKENISAVIWTDYVVRTGNTILGEKKFKIWENNLPFTFNVSKNNKKVSRLPATSCKIQPIKKQHNY